MTRVSKLLEEWEVYSPKEEEENPGMSEHRPKFDSTDIRNIMMSYFMYNEPQQIYDVLREHIDKMPDEWVVEFLRHQDDTVVERV